ncbi:hypothetical protein IFM89_036175 [Coptis chinensis]|uniref:F-box domain-containing protein n=1 Tax=Coptis chinensis TaxID=261450 RepID=A0A835H4U9_9MAGN|nr:hypothetical protein IFM89_036175 [Coptis chinensis]
MMFIGTPGRASSPTLIPTMDIHRIARPFHGGELHTVESTHRLACIDYRVLHFKDVTFSWDESQPAQQVTFSLPVFEEFQIKACLWLYMIITIVALVLKSLCVVDTFGTLDCLDDECYNCEMKILCVGDLKSLTFDCNFLRVYSLHKLPSLVDPSMNFVGTQFMGNNAVHQVFREFCDVNDLEVSSSVVEVLFRPEISSIMPNLLKVINLEINKTYDGLDGSSLICLLSDMPNIESLVFSDTHWTFGVNLQILPTLPVVICNVSNQSIEYHFREIVYSGNPPVIREETLSCLSNAEFEFASPPKDFNGIDRNLIECRAFEILEWVRNVKKLALEGLYIEFLTRHQELLARLPTSCATVKHLKLDLYPDKKPVEVVMFLLRRYPNLQTLCISIKTPSLTSMGNMGGQIPLEELNSQSMLKCLRKVEIKYFGGSGSELDLNFFLKRVDATLNWIKCFPVHSSKHKVSITECSLPHYEFMIHSVCKSFDHHKCIRMEMDRISNLPEPIRSHILDFLPMEDAFRTSILSRQWRYVCFSLSNLTFDQHSFMQKNYGDFACFGLPPDISLETLLSLRTASFTWSVTRSDQRASYIHPAHKIVAGLRNVTELCLYDFYIEALTSRDPVCLPTYSTLKHLHLHMFPIENQVQAVIILLKRTPNLQTLGIYVMMGDTMQDTLVEKEYWQPQELYSVHTLDHLKLLKIESLQGTESEFRLLRHLFENGNAIERMNICYSKEMTEAGRTDFSEKLMKLVRVSTEVEISAGDDSYKPHTHVFRWLTV